METKRNNLKFYNRKEELNVLSRYLTFKNMLVVVYGRRRVGKTRLIEQLLKQTKKRYIKLLLPEDKISGSIVEQWLSELSKEGYTPKLNSLYEIIRFIVENKNMVLFIDEFQNIIKLDYNVMSLLQGYADSRKGRFILSGSFVGMMKKIFKDRKSPLFNRSDMIVNLKPLSIYNVFKILEDIGIKSTEDKLKLYFIFGGIPYYYRIIKGFGEKDIKKIIKSFFIMPPTNLLSKEGHNILINEFGLRYKVYFSILEAISRGRTSLKEISDFVKIKQTTLMKYIIHLQREYEVISRIVPATFKAHKHKEGLYIIKDQLFRFWFRYIYPNETYLDSEMFDYVYDNILSDINNFFGLGFEQTILSILKENLILKHLGFTKIGRQWGKFKGEKGRNTYEIDILALNEKTKNILFGECKWKRVNAEKVCKELAEKSKHVEWNNKKRKEHFAIFAKSFSKRIKKFNGKPVYCFDLKDMEKAIRKSRK